MSLSRSVVISSYRSIVRHGLRAVNFRAPQKYILLAYIREKFRSTPNQDVTVDSLENTVKFMKNASEFTGLENRLVQNLVHVYHSRVKNKAALMHIRHSTDKKKVKDRELLNEVQSTYANVVKSLNSSANLCL